MLLVTCLENKVESSVTQKQDTKIQTVLSGFFNIINVIFNILDISCHDITPRLMFNSVISYRFQYLIIVQPLVILLLSNINMSFPSLFNSPVSFSIGPNSVSYWTTSEIWNTITGEVHKFLQVEVKSSSVCSLAQLLTQKNLRPSQTHKLVSLGWQCQAYTISWLVEMTVPHINKLLWGSPTSNYY